MKHPATVCWLSGEVSVHRLQGKPEEVTLVWQKWAMVQPFGNHRVVATTSLPKIPMNFPLQNLPISPASFPRQVRGLTTDTHFEELMKTFCRCAEINPLICPKLELDLGTAPAMNPRHSKRCWHLFMPGEFGLGAVGVRKTLWEISGSNGLLKY